MGIKSKNWTPVVQRMKIKEVCIEKYACTGRECGTTP